MVSSSVVNLKPCFSVRQLLMAARLSSNIFGSGATSSKASKIEAIAGGFDQRLIHEVLDRVLAADIDNEGDLRLKRNDVRKVLFRSDTDVCAVGFPAFRQVCEYALGRKLIGYEVVGGKVPARFGEVGYDLPKRLIAELRRQFC